MYQENGNVKNQDDGETVDIMLSRGFITTVDKEVFERIKEYKWTAWTGKRKDGSISGVYAVNYYNNENGKRDCRRLHRIIMEAKPYEHVDHIDGNTLNNRLSNLRLCNCSENQGNSKKTVFNKTSKYKGVCWEKGVSRWRAAIMLNKKHIFIGHFKNETDAALAYNKAAVLYFGEFARLNVVSVEI